LDHGEALGIQLRKPLQVLADLFRAAHARQQSNNGLAGLCVCLHGLLLREVELGSRAFLPRICACYAEAGSSDTSWNEQLWNSSERRGSVARRLPGWLRASDAAKVRSWSSATHSSAVWAWAMWPAPKTMASRPAAENSEASVQMSSSLPMGSPRSS